MLFLSLLLSPNALLQGSKIEQVKHEVCRLHVFICSIRFGQR